MLLKSRQDSHFRAAELDDMVGVLGERRPALMVVSGAPGMGKTSLLRELAVRAATLGWAVAGDDEVSIVVDPRTQLQDLARDVLFALDGAVPPPGELLSTRWHVQAQRADPLVGELARRSPLLVVIDDYRPSSLFAGWFEDVFVPGMQRSQAPLVVAVAQRMRGRRLDPVATDVFDLDALDPEFVRRELTELGARLDPPLTDTELEAYVREAKTPLILDSLMQVLSLAADRQAKP